MDSDLKRQLAESLPEILRSLLSTGQAVSVPGLGRFQVAHEASSSEERPDGSIILHPPTERIIFTDENTGL